MTLANMIQLDISSILNNSNLATWITAITTMVYTVGTFMLWWTTNNSIKITKQEIKRKEEILNATYISNVYRNFREIYSAILNNADMSKVLYGEQQVTEDDIKKNYIGSFLINHAFEIYNYNHNKLLPDTFWQSVIIDMRVLFGWKFIKDRWDINKNLYTKEFISFIEKEIMEAKK